MTIVRQTQNHKILLHAYHFVEVPPGFPGDARGKEPACQCRRHERWGFDPSVRKIPWRRAWQPTPIFIPGESPWTEETGELQSIGLQRVRHN